MKKCLAIKPTLNKDIFMFMQSDSITPISFNGNKIEQNTKGLYLKHKMSYGWYISEIFNIRDIGERTVAISRFDDPVIQVFTSTEKYKI